VREGGSAMSKKRINERLSHCGDVIDKTILKHRLHWKRSSFIDRREVLGLLRTFSKKALREYVAISTNSSVIFPKSFSRIISLI
jgi:hypothetical protein